MDDEVTCCGGSSSSQYGGIGGETRCSGSCFGIGILGVMAVLAFVGVIIYAFFFGFGVIGGKPDDAYDRWKWFMPDVVAVNDAKTSMAINTETLLVQGDEFNSGVVVINPVPFERHYYDGETSVPVDPTSDSHSSSPSSSEEIIIFKREAQLAAQAQAIEPEGGDGSHSRIQRSSTYVPGVDPALDVNGIIRGQLVSYEKRTAASAADIASIMPGDVIGLTTDGTVKASYGGRLIESVTTMTTSRAIKTTMFGTSNNFLFLYMNETDFLIARRGTLNATTGDPIMSSVEFAVDGRAHISALTPSFTACSVQVTNISSPEGAALPAGNNTAFIAYLDPITGHPVGILCDFTIMTAVQCSALQYFDNSTVGASIQDIWCHPVPDYDEGEGHYKQQTLLALAYTNSATNVTSTSVQVLVRGGYLNDRRVRPTHPTSIVGVNSGTSSGVWRQGIACTGTTNLTYTASASFSVARLHPIDEAHFALVFGGDNNGSELNLGIMSIDYETNGVIDQEACYRNIYSDAGTFYAWYSAMGEAISTSDGPMRYLTVSINGEKAVGYQVAYTADEVPLPDDDDDEDNYYSWTDGPAVVAIGTDIVTTLTHTRNVTYIENFNYRYDPVRDSTRYFVSGATNLGQTGVVVYTRSNGPVEGGTFATVFKYDASAAIGEIAAITVLGEPRSVQRNEMLLAAPASRNVFGTPRTASSLDYLGVRTIVGVTNWVDFNRQSLGLQVSVAASQAFASYVSFRDFSLPQRPYGVALTAPDVNGTLSVQSFGDTNPCLLRALASISYGSLPICTYGFTGPVYACPGTAVPSISSTYGNFATDVWAEYCVQLGIVESSATGSITLTPNEWTSLDQTV